MKIVKVKDVIASIAKKHGEETASIGVNLPDVERVSSGVFPFDLASGGGWPMGKISTIYGMEGSGKTNLLLKTIAHQQMLEPDKHCIFMDIEYSFDKLWATRLGVNCDKLVLIRPKMAEDAVDQIEALLSAEDAHVVVVDSLAAMIPELEAINSTDREQVGGNSKLIGKFMRKAVHAMGEAQKNGIYTTLLLINQMRIKVGQQFGDPEIQPGGQALKHTSGLTVKLYGKPVMDKSISETQPAFRSTSITFKKYKVPIVSSSCKYDMTTLPHNGTSPGFIDDWPNVKTYLQSMGLVVKGDKNKGYVFQGETYSTWNDLRDGIYEDVELLDQTRSQIIQQAMAAIHGEG